uniref:NAC domain-containing protein 69 n=1 Tax=Noccaea caerulescens TaxID=107243 RepID=A0A1J3GPB3_NOCCA
MEKDLVGYRFHPTGEELINHYLKNKILGKHWLVDDAISEINICSYEPMFLPSLSKLESKDPVWYFFSRREYTSAKKTAAKRITSSGFWKATGKDRKIKDKRGNGVEIGIKKTLVYHQGRVPKGVWTPWVMHEYHITCLPLHQRTYVICQVMYKGEDGDVFYGNNNFNVSEPSHSLASDLNTVTAINTEPEVEHPGQENLYGISVDDLLNPMNEQEDLSPSDGFNPDTLFSDDDNNNNNNTSLLQPQTHYDNEYWSGLLSYNGGNFEDVFPNPELMMLENHSNYRPKKALSGIIDSDSGDSDAESISAASYQETSSPGDSVGSSNRHFPRCSSTDSFKDLQTLESQLTCRTTPSKHEVKEVKSKAAVAAIDKESSMVKAEKKGWFITEEAMQRKGKTPRYSYLMNMVIGFILLVALIGNFISVLRSVKTRSR